MTAWWMSLWAWDQAVFRALHTLGQEPWVRPIALVITDTGLGQVQAAALLVAASRVWARAGRIALVVAIAVGVGIPASVDVYPWAHLLALGLVVALLGGIPARTAWVALGAAAGAGLVRLGLMRYADRQRPSNFDFARPYEDVFGMSSFPSGHATTTFAIAFTVLLAREQDARRRAGWVLAWAVAVALSRSFAGVHYVTDTVAGAGMGLAGACVAWMVADARARRTSFAGSS